MLLNFLNDIHRRLISSIVNCLFLGLLLHMMLQTPIVQLGNWHVSQPVNTNYSRYFDV